MKTKTERTSIKNWYMKGQYIPQLGTIQFAKFAAHGFSLIKEIKKSDVFYRIDPMAPTAYYDHINRAVALPGWYFIPEAIARFSDMKDPAADALTLINGSTIHEALHAQHTKFAPDHYIREVQELFGFRVSQQLVAIIANTVEDLSIESNKKLSEYQKDWLRAKNALLFSDKVWAELESKIDKSSPMQIAQALSAYKREDLRERMATLFNPEILALLETVIKRNLMPPVDKTRIIFAIVKQLLKDSVPPPKSEMTSAPGDGDKTPDKTSDKTEDEDGNEDDSKTSDKTEDEFDDDEDEDGGGSGDFDDFDDAEPELDIPDQEYDEEPIDNSKVQNDSPKSEEVEEALEEAAEKAAEKLEKMAKEFANEFVKEFKKNERTETLGVNKYTLDELRKHLSIKEISEISVESLPLRPINLTNRFVNLLKQMRTVLPQHGRGKLSGGKIDVLRLHQVAIDNKVFSTKTIDQSGNNDKVEVIILVDGSGSMSRTEGYWSTYQTCLSVSHKIFKALVSANILTQVWTHTSSGYDNWPLLVKIANNLTRNFDKKFELAGGMDLHENLDGIIIEELAKNHFTSDTRIQRILLVLSDGSPQSPSYPNHIGIPHTHVAIEDARKSGIKVYSLSLVKGVVECNSKIYGAEYNIDASANLDKEMVNLVTQLVRRK